MNIAQIIKERNGGYLRVDSRRVYNSSLEQVMGLFGLEPNSKLLEECDIDYAIEVVKTILWRDLAYNTEMVPEETALERATFLVNQFYEVESKLFTNGDFKDYHVQSTSSFNPLTNATFSAGIIILNSGYAACILAEDED
ncbi:MAG: hypothetical protein ACJAS1_007168 [Oleiphilaceae bacterium]|jgi:hypothetical protein